MSLPLRHWLSLLLLAQTASHGIGLWADPTPDTTRPLAALIEFKAGTGDDVVLANLTDRLFRELSKTHQWQLVERNRVDAVLREPASLQTASCSTSCTASLGQRLGVGTLLVPGLERTQGISHLSLREISATTGAVLRQAEAETEEPLNKAGKLLARLVVGRLIQSPNIPRNDSGTVTITSEPSSTIWIDGLPVGQTPVKVQLWPGPHRIAISSGVEAPVRKRRNSLIPDISVGTLISIQSTYHEIADIQRALTGSGRGDNNNSGSGGVSTTNAIVAGSLVAAAGAELLSSTMSTPEVTWADLSHDIEIKTGESATVEFHQQAPKASTAQRVMGVLGTVFSIALVVVIAISKR